jgi:type II secretion system protein I
MSGQALKKPKGFTLIEVLIAMVIIAIACFAVLHVVASSLSMQSRLEQHTVGSWIAQNTLADLRAGALNFDVGTQTAKDSMLMLYQLWPWQAHLLTQDSFIGHYDRPVGISVKDPMPPNSVIWRMQGYLPLEQVPHE